MSAVSIIIPTYNRVDRLKRVLSALERQKYPLPSVEVVIVSDGSTDGTHEYLRSLQTPLNMQLVVQTNQGPAAARNRGIQAAQGEFALFIDDDVVPAEQLIAEHMCVHTAHDEEVIVLGPMLTPDDFTMAPWVRWEQAMLMKQYRAMENGDWAPTARQFYTGNTSLRRAHIQAAGGFDETLRRAEDVELAYRLADRGLTFIFNSQAIGYHYAERSFRSWFAIPYTYGRNDALFAHTKGQDWILDAVREEFSYRHPLAQMLVKLCLDRKLLSGATMWALRLAARVAQVARIERLSQASYSALFNLRYYQGLIDELGDRSVLQ